MNTWTVTSNTDPGKSYQVVADEESGIWTCDCPFVPRRNGGPKYCSHIFAKQAEIVSGKTNGPKNGHAPEFSVFTRPGAAFAAGAAALLNDSLKKADELVKANPPAAEDWSATTHVPDGKGGERLVLDEGEPAEELSGHQVNELAKLELEYEAEQAALDKAIEEALLQEPSFEVTDIESAISAVYAEVAYVQKQYSDALKYSFAGEAAIIRSLRQSLVKHHINVAVTKTRNRTSVQYETKHGTAMTNTSLEVRTTFTHAPSKTKKHVWSWGEGSDSGDKATGKASTGAYKYALRQTFMLETGDDPDLQPSGEQERAPRAPSASQRRDAVRDNLNRRGPSAPGDTPPWWQWFVNERNKLGLVAKDLTPVLGKPGTPLNVSAHLDTLDPRPQAQEDISSALLRLLSRAADWKAKEDEARA